MSEFENNQALRNALATEADVLTSLSGSEFNSQEATMTVRTYDKIEACRVLGIKHFAHLRRLVLDGKIVVEGSGPSKNKNVMKVLLNADSVDTYAKTMQHRGSEEGVHAFEIKIDPTILKAFLNIELATSNQEQLDVYGETLAALANAIDLTEKRREYNKKHNGNTDEA